jgi:hypothetical protein
MGTFLIIMIAVFIGTGYLLSDSINTHKDLLDAKQQIDDLLRERHVIQSQLDVANSQVATLIAQNDEFKRQIFLLYDQIAQAQEEHLLIKNQNARLRSQLDRMKKINQLSERILMLFSQSPKLALFIPILPASLAATFVLYRYRQRRIAGRNNWQTQSNRTENVKLTEEEWKTIINIRRKR